MNAPLDALHLPDPVLGARLKGWPAGVPPLHRSQVGAQGWQVLADDLPLPLAVIRRAALAHNLGWMQRLAEGAGIALAPHGKTTLSPELFAAQLSAGAWGITFADVQQLALGVAGGVRRALIANQVLQRTDLLALAALRNGHPGLRAPFFVDSAEQLALIEAVPVAEPFEVLLELGLPGGRTGCRDDAAALSLARRLRASPAVRLVGLATYEGLWGSGDDGADRALVDTLMRRVHALRAAIEAEGLFEADEVIVTAGGSALFDLVAPWLTADDGAGARASRLPVRGLLRSGCYVTHDDGHYQRLVQVANRRLGCADADGLRAALVVWALVQSCPEPGLAILNAGKRDLSFDMGLPQPRWVARRGERVAQAAPPQWQVVALNDQHAHVRLGADAAGLQVGDRVGLGISHPCTTFDKWRWMPVVDEDWRVVDAITTGF